MSTKLLIKASGVEIFMVALKPENASLMGYKYIEDVSYNVMAPKTDKHHILQLIYKRGYKLGEPIQINKPVYGLYAPIRRKIAEVL